MSLGAAIRYPFQSGNIIKLLPIAIVYAIILFLTISAGIGVGYFVGSLASFVFTLFISGYYVSAIASIQQGEERLPDVALSTDLRRGLASIIAGFIYMLPIIIFMVTLVAWLFVVIAASMSGGGVQSNDVDGISAGFGLFALVMFVLGLLLSPAYIVGLCRYAAERRLSALFNVPKNVGMAWGNAGKTITLFILLIVISLIAGVFSGISSSGASSLIFGQSQWNEPNTAQWVIYSLITVISYTITLIFTMMSVHLFADYGIALGIGGRKMKDDE